MQKQEFMNEAHLLVLMPERFPGAMRHLGDLPHGDAIVRIVGVNATSIAEIVPALKEDQKLVSAMLHTAQNGSERNSLHRRIGYTQNLCEMLNDQSMQRVPDKKLLSQVAATWTRQALKPKDTVYLAGLPSFPVSKGLEKNLMK